jgi:hypothetical protein
VLDFFENRGSLEDFQNRPAWSQGNKRERKRHRNLMEAK